ncbi:putative N6-adenine methyltransferase-domain-containing protein [Coniochaeta sp. 2T2.1]|nr:putative N6-adenine methyltransferase-domain-containing protein [Coniochaeta sp. 2T2.1]
MADSDDELSLSISTLDALKSFYAERDARAQEFERLAAAAQEQREALAAGEPLSMSMFTEDWDKSQFWYSDETATHYAKQLLEGAGPDMTVVVVSAPSVFVQLKNLVDKAEGKPVPKILLLEHDNRFAVFKEEFVFYDFKHPIRLPAHLKGTADRVIVDPPFLSEDCQTKAALTVRWLSKPVSEVKDAYRVIVSTGERMGGLITGKLYKSLGVRTTDYEIGHAMELGNEFYCYANYSGEKAGWGWRNEEDS